MTDHLTADILLTSSLFLPLFNKINQTHFQQFKMHLKCIWSISSLFKFSLSPLSTPSLSGIYPKPPVLTKTTLFIILAMSMQTVHKYYHSKNLHSPPPIWFLRIHKPKDILLTSYRQGKCMLCFIRYAWVNLHQPGYWYITIIILPHTTDHNKTDNNDFIFFVPNVPIWLKSKAQNIIFHYQCIN